MADITQPWAFTEVPDVQPNNTSLERDRQRKRHRRRAEEFAYSRLPDLHQGLTTGEKDIYIDADKLGEWLEDVETELDGDGVRGVREFLRKGFARGLCRLGWRIPTPGRLVQLIDEKPLLHIHTLSDSQLAYSAIDALCASAEDATLFSERAIESTQVRAQRLAQLAVALVLGGAILAEEDLYCILESVPYGVNIYDGLMWVELEHGEYGNGARRWLATPLPGLLLLRWRRQRLPPCFECVPKENLWSAVREFLVAYSPAGKCPFPSLKGLLRSAASYHATRLDSATLGIAERSINTTSLPAAAWWRWLTGLPARISESPENVEENYFDEGDSVPSPRFADSAAEKDPTVSLKTLTQLLHCKPGRFKRFANSGICVHGNERKKLGEQIQKHLSDFLHLHGPALPPIVYFLGCWSEHQYRYGTRYQQSKEPRTIYGYLVEIGSLLVDAFEWINPIDIGSGELELIYSTVIEAEPRSRSAERTNRLVTFHEFLVGKFGAEEVDWSMIGERRSGPSQVDANLLTPTEYARTWQLLADDDASDDMKDLRLAALTLLYRFGTRIFECLKLCMGDIMVLCSAKYIELVIRPSEYGRVKTAAGIRWDESACRFNGQELALLERVVQRRIKQDRNFDPDSLLFAKPDHPGELLAESALSWRILAAARAATGDASFQLHHLRHSCVSLNLLASQVSGEVHALAERLGDWHTSESWSARNLATQGQTRKIHHRVSAGVGHATSFITLERYANLNECLLLEAQHEPGFEKSSNTEISFSALANLTGVKKVTLEKRAQRAKVVPENSSAEKPTLTDLFRIAMQRISRNDWTAPPIKLGSSSNIVLPPEKDSDGARETYPFRPEKIFAVLRASHAGMRSSQISRREHVQRSIVDGWINAYSEITKLRTPDGAARHHEHTKERTFDAFDRLVCGRIEQMLAASDEVFLSGLLVFLYRVSPGKLPHMDLENIDELSLILTCLTKIGFSMNAMRIVPGVANASEIENFKRKFPEVDLIWDENHGQKSKKARQRKGLWRLHVKLDESAGQVKARDDHKFTTQHHQWLLCAAIYVLESGALDLRLFRRKP